MPVFDFKCPKCGKVVEKLVKYSEIHDQTCPECGTTMDRQHTVGKLRFHFNYIED